MPKFDVFQKSAARLPLLAFFAATMLFAQAGYEAQIRGTVTDPAGGVVPGAAVTLTTPLPISRLPPKPEARDSTLLTGSGPPPTAWRCEAPGFARF